MVEELQLTVAPILEQENVGKNIAGISEDTMQKLGVKEGNILEIESITEKLTYANFMEEENREWEDKDASRTGTITRQSNNTEENTNSIRLDRFTQENIEVLIGEKVSVEKADVNEAEEITVFPVMPGKQEFAELEKLFLGRPVSKGDVVTFLNSFSATFPDSDEEKEIFRINFTVNDTQPEGIVLVTENTTVEQFKPEKGE